MSDPQPNLGEFEQLLLLAILQLGDDAYAVPIRALIAERTGRHVARGALYTSLERLETKRLLSSRVGEPLAVLGGRARRYFSVTPAGLDALRSAHHAMTALARGLDGLLTKR